jgi:hypothetical protein
MLRTYVIRSGAHFANGLHFRFSLFRDRLYFRARFDAGCVYVPLREPEQINKLFGLSWGRHHQCTARIGWRSDGRRIELLSYVYVAAGQRASRTLGFVDPRTWFLCAIERQGTALTVEVLGMEAHHYTLARPRVWGYQLYPYFGGTDRAPQRMEIQIEENDGAAFGRAMQPRPGGAGLFRSLR